MVFNRVSGEMIHLKALMLRDLAYEDALAIYGCVFAGYNSRA